MFRDIKRGRNSVPENEDSDTCRRQEDGTAEPIRKEVSRGREVKKKKSKKRKSKAGKAKKAIERRKTNIKEKRNSSPIRWSCSILSIKMVQVEKVKIGRTTGGMSVSKN